MKTSPHVLVVDDKEENTYFLKVLLEGHHHTVETARHGAEALVKARQNPPDLVISDLLMPVMDGYTLLRHWKTDPKLKKIPFIVYTATYTETEDERLAFSLGADAFILKPAEPADFLKKTMEVLERDSTGSPPEPRIPPEDTQDLFKVYSETLIRKLEEKSLLLEQANQALKQDILRREQTEAALRASEERFELAVHGSAAALWDWNALTGEIYYAPRYAEMLGYSPEEFAPHFDSFWNAVHPDDRPLLELDLNAHLKDPNLRYDVTFRMRTKTGTYRWFRATGQAVTPAGSDKATRMVGTTWDITPEKEADLRLRSALAEARQFREALDQVPAHIYIKDLSSQYLYANKSTLELFGCTAEELKGSDDTRFFPPETAAQLRNVDQEVFQGHMTALEINVPYIQGRRRVYWETKTPIRSEGEDQTIIGLLGISTDITTQKETEETLRQSEERFRQMAENIQEVFWMTDPLQTQILYVSPAFEQIWGHSCEALAQDPEIWIRSIHPEDRERMKASIERILALPPGGVSDETYRIQHADGSDRWIRDRAFPVFDETGKIHRVVGIAEDITERRKLESQFLRAQRMESIGTLAGGIAHDLNNLLAPILMSAPVLGGQINDPGGREMMATVQTCAQRAADLVRQVLSFARGMEGRRISVNARHLGEDMRKIAAETFPKNIEFRFECDPTLWTVSGDPTQIHQVIVNLCVNGRDAMPKGGRLRLAMENITVDDLFANSNADAVPGRYVVIRVEDSGTGIPAKIRDRIFEPFFTTKEPGLGTGLGLSTTMAIVKSHGGFITVHSETNAGTRFDAYFPAEGTMDSPVSGTPIPLEEFPKGRGELILVIDDEEGIRSVVKKTLETYGYRVLLASQGAEAVTLYAQHRTGIALVITDMAMPIMDGPTTIAALQAIHPQVRIIGSSGVTEEKNNGSPEICGTRAFLPKPYTVGKLLATVRGVIDAG